MITMEKDFVLCLKALFLRFKQGLSEGKYFVFPPDKILIPKEGLKCEEDLVFSHEVKDISPGEAFRQLGVTLYHLVFGESEHNSLSYQIDGYNQTVPFVLWSGLVSSLLKGEIKSPEVIEGMFFDEPERETRTETPELLNGRLTQNPIASPTKPQNREVSSSLLLPTDPQLFVLTAENAFSAWRISEAPKTRIRYFGDTIRQCIQENKKGADWRLVYVIGMSLREQFNRLLAIDCFSGNYRPPLWWHDPKETFKDYKPSTGYRLINFQELLHGKNWNEQEKYLGDLGPSFERCHEAVFAELMFSISTLTGKNFSSKHESMFGYCAWGSSFTSHGHVVVTSCVPGSKFFSAPFLIGHWNRKDSGPFLCLMRNFDF